MLHRLGQNVRGGVPEGALAVLILKGEDFERAVGLEREAQIAHLAVYPARAGGLCQTRAERRGDLPDRRAGLVFADNAAFQCYLDHRIHLLFTLYSLKKQKSSTPDGVKLLISGSTVPPELVFYSAGNKIPLFRR